MAAAGTHQHALRCDLLPCAAKQGGRAGGVGALVDAAHRVGSGAGCGQQSIDIFLCIIGRKIGTEGAQGVCLFGSGPFPGGCGGGQSLLHAIRQQGCGQRQKCIRHAVQLFAGSWCDDQGSVAAHVDAAGGVHPHCAGGRSRGHRAAAQIGRQIRHGGSIGQHGPGVGVHAQHPKQLAGDRNCRAGKRPHILRRQFYDAAFAVHAHYLTVGRHKLLCPCGSSLGTGCTAGCSGTVGAGALCRGLGLCRIGCRACSTGCGTLRGGGSGTGTFQHTRHELLILRGRQLFRAAVSGQDGVGVVAAGPGIGGVAAGIDGCQHPLSAGASGQAAVHGDAVLRVQ